MKLSPVVPFNALLVVFMAGQVSGLADSAGEYTFITLYLSAGDLHLGSVSACMGKNALSHGIGSQCSWYNIPASEQPELEDPKDLPRNKEVTYTVYTGSESISSFKSF